MQSKLSELDLWQTLVSLTGVEFTARSKLATGWNGSGKGQIDSSLENNSTLIFHENGTWIPDSYPETEIAFANTYRWKRSESHLDLEHLRFGMDKPVYLVRLIQDEKSPTRWITKEPHLCNKDLYSATVDLGLELVKVDWIIIGPKKNEFISYKYT